MSNLSDNSFAFVAPEKWELPDILQFAFSEDFRASPQFWIAGAGALRVILGKANEGVWAGDWEVYCTPKAFSRLQENTGLEFRAEQHEYQEYCDLYRNDSEKLQVYVGKQYALPTAIYFAFDISVTRVALSAGGVVFDPLAFNDILNGVFRVCIETHKQSEQVATFRGRGFTLVPELAS